MRGFHWEFFEGSLLIVLDSRAYRRVIFPFILFKIESSRSVRPCINLSARIVSNYHFEFLIVFALEGLKASQQSN